MSELKYACTGCGKLHAAWGTMDEFIDLCEPIPDEPETPSDDEIARLRAGYRRYEIARKMNPQQWAAAWSLNIKTGKPFDQIIDESASQTQRRVDHE